MIDIFMAMDLSKPLNILLIIIIVFILLTLHLNLIVACIVILDHLATKWNSLNSLFVWGWEMHCLDSSTALQYLAR